MKKFTSLLCMGTLALAASAAVQVQNPIDGSQFQLREDAAAKVMEAQKEAQMFIDNGEADLTRSFIDKNGREWVMAFFRSSSYNWSDMLINNDGSKPTLEQFPFYVGFIQMMTMDEKNLLWYVVTWPSEFCITQAFDSNFDADKDEMKLDPADPILILNADKVPVTNANKFLGMSWGSAENPEGFNNLGFVTDEDSMFQGWSLLGINQMFTNTITINGLDARVEEPTSEANMSYFEFESFNNGTSNIVFYNKNYYVMDASGQKGNMTINWTEGTASVYGFVTYTFPFPEMAELHIFKDKVLDYDAIFELGYENFVEDVFRYRFLFLAPNLAIKTDCSFEDCDFNPLFTSQEAVNSDGFSFIQGAMFAPTTMTDFDFTDSTPYVVQHFEQELDYNKIPYVTTCPIPYGMIPSGYTFAPCNNGYISGSGDSMVTNWTADGVCGLHKSYFRYFGEPSQIQFGTKDGVVGYFVNQKLDTDYVTFSKQAYYHNDPSDLSKYVMVDVMGTAEPEAPSAVKELPATEADNALNVVVNGNSILAPAGSVVYDLNGRQVGSEGLAQGVYVVRCGKAAAKVLVK